MYIGEWRYPVNFSVHYNIHYITFTILVRETWNDFHIVVVVCNFISQFSTTFFDNIYSVIVN